MYFIIIFVLDNDNDNEISFISIKTFTHDKQWKYRKVKKSWTFPFLHQYITAALNQFIQSIIGDDSQEEPYRLTHTC